MSDMHTMNTRERIDILCGIERESATPTATAATRKQQQRRHRAK